MKTISAALLAAPVFAGWNIISQSSNNACHILENGCIADDRVGNPNQNYANGEQCTFEGLTRLTGCLTGRLGGHSVIQLVKFSLSTLVGTDNG